VLRASSASSFSNAIASVARSLRGPARSLTPAAPPPRIEHRRARLQRSVDRDGTHAERQVGQLRDDPLERRAADADDTGGRVGLVEQRESTQGSCGSSSSSFRYRP